LLGGEIKILGILEYTSGLNFASAVTLNQNPFFEMACNILLKSFEAGSMIKYQTIMKIGKFSRYLAILIFLSYIKSLVEQWIEIGQAK
jgi:hypothetical protein